MSSSSAQRPSALLGLLGILALVVGAWFFSMKTPHGDPDKNDNTGKEGDSSPKESSVITKIMPTPPTKQNTEQHCYIQTPWWKTLAELVGIGAVIWYACLTHNMWREMQTQTGIQRDTEVNAERPWIGFEEGPQIDAHFNGKDFHASEKSSLKNYGKSPAFRIIPWGTYIPLTDSETVKRKQESLCFGSNTATSAQSQIPNGIAWKALDIQRAGGQEAFPGKTIPFIEDTTGIEGIPDPQKPLFYVGCITYSDEFGDSVPLRHTRFCYSVDLSSATNPVGPCPWGNNAD